MTTEKGSAIRSLENDELIACILIKEQLIILQLR